MKAHSEKDPQCVPNVITYSALMTACCSGGRPDKAHEVFQDMVASGIKPDQISYSTLIAGEQPCLREVAEEKIWPYMQAASILKVFSLTIDGPASQI